MRAPDVRRRRLGDARALVGAALLVACTTAAAHKSSDAYLQLDAGPERLELRLDVALRDLDVALDLDADGDGKLTWGEVKAAWLRIEALASAKVAVGGCDLRPAAAGPALERRSDGAYAVLRYASSCRLADPAPIRYALFAELDPTHRGLAKVQRPGASPQLIVLDPSRAGAGGAGAAAVAGPAGSGASATSAVAAAAAATVAPSRWQFLSEGVHHIVTGYDHVLFLICLLLPAVLRREGGQWRPVGRTGEAIWPVVGTVTAFTVAHSVTLALAALKLVALPASLIEPAIAVTIGLAAVDNLRPIFPVPRIAVAFFFGLIHGFGFAGVLAELELPRTDFAWALLQFNLGLELGQLVIVGLVVTALFATRHSRFYRPVVLRGGSLLALAIAATWLVERVGDVKILPF